MGAMMLANLHGLTRSRPDILAESLANAFNAPAKIPKESIGSFLEAKLAEGEVVREFEKIPKKKTVGCNVSVATMPENIARNRFRDVVPYDENRVKITNDKENKLGYVNASHISATVGDSQRFYIAAQGPMANTVHNFWAMVQECDVHLIVMLTEVSGASKASASIPYWPQNDGSSLELGEFTITKRFSSESGSYTTTTLQLTHGPSKKVRTVWHLQYSGWQDHGCPEDVGEYLTFMEELSALRRHTVSEVAAGKNRNTPVLVHCSAGVGRTGVTILSDILRYCADHNIDIDIPKVLSHLRQQRMLMVQTVAQYKFVHTALIHYLGQSRLI
jgi:tyrosine-protein phosphatase non-receptor type 14/21